MTESRGADAQLLPEEPTDEQAREAARWWIEERPDWRLDRALRVWLIYEANGEEGYWWEGGPAYDRWFEAVLAAAHEVRKERG